MLRLTGHTNDCAKKKCLLSIERLYEVVKQA